MTKEARLQGRKYSLFNKYIGKNEQPHAQTKLGLFLIYNTQKSTQNGSHT